MKTYIESRILFIALAVITAWLFVMSFGGFFNREEYTTNESLVVTLLCGVVVFGSIFLVCRSEKREP